MSEITPMGPVDYARPVAPERYRCACGVHGVKLWREYSTFLNHQTLACVDCAIKQAGRPLAVEQAPDGHIKVDGDRQDAIAWRVPAVPTTEGDAFWKYSSVPAAGCTWWYSLPLRLVP